MMKQRKGSRLTDSQSYGKPQVEPADDFDEVVNRNNVHEFYTHRHQLPTINNLLLVLKTDIMSTIHEN